MQQYMKVFGSCDSYTYVDILPNGKKISECTREELSEMVDAHSDVLTYSHGFNRGIQMQFAPMVQALREEVPSLRILTDAL